MLISNTSVRQDRTINMLMVDDDEDDYVIICNMLKESQNFSFKIDWMRNYHSVPKVLSENNYDAYLMDYHLGILGIRNGIDLLREGLERGCRKPLILLTGRTGSEIDKMALKAGASYFLHKSSIDASLLERVILYSIQQKDIERMLEKKRHYLTEILHKVSDFRMKI